MNKLNRKLLILLSFYFLPLVVVAQQSLFDQTEYDNFVLGGAELHSVGFGGFFRYGKKHTDKTNRFIHIGLSRMKHPKEEKRASNFVNARGYYFGKQNGLTLLQLGVGQSHLVFWKNNFNGVQVRFNYTAGVDIGLIKPYYLLIGYPSSDPTRNFDPVVEKYNPDIPDIDNSFLNPYPGRVWPPDYGAIIEPAGFMHGFDEMTMIPGLFLRSGLLFEFGSYSDDIRGIEVGGGLDILTKKAPIMIFIDNKQLFGTLYLKVLFGKKI